MYLREHTTLAKMAAGFGISESTAHASTSTIVDLLAARAPGLLKTLREHRPDFVLLDGTPAACDRVGDGRADHSHQHRRHGVKCRSSPAPTATAVALARLAGPHPRPDRRPHPRDHPDQRALAHLAYQGAVPELPTGIRRKPLQEVTPTEKALSQALAAARTSVDAASHD